ncbi:MAG: hypothetical protein ACTJGD_03565 [Mesonia hippocampi]|uniref:hypothetical protein n=1 Tax=Mesonia hippocampi TaxID=1628250 RepID=UPI003F99F249
MKKLSILISFLFCGIVTVANTNLHPKSHTYSSAIIFTEQHIDFAIYPDGQFDFYIQNSKPNAQLVINTPHVNISFNSGYNYNPYIQYDDFGAVIQIENVPVFYDYYGRVSRIGNIFIDYNLGRLQRVGNMYLVYNPAGIFMGYQGYINPYNRTYVYKPQHKHFRKPPVQHRIVYTRPYRSYYQPKRKSYKSFKKYYKNNTDAYPRRYYKPSDAVTTYHRGRSNLNKTSSNREVYDYNNRTSRKRNTASSNRTNTTKFQNQPKYNRAATRSSRNHDATKNNRQRSSKNARTQHRRTANGRSKSSNRI